MISTSTSSRPGFIWSLIRFVILPFLWRAGLSIGIYLVLHTNWLDGGFTELYLSESGAPGPNTKFDSMFYAISGVLGIVAGFMITAISIIGAGTSRVTRSMLQRSSKSLPLKLLYSVGTLFVAALITALAGPFANEHSMPFYILHAVLAISFIEVLCVGILVFIALRPVDKKQQKLLEIDT